MVGSRTAAPGTSTIVTSHGQNDAGLFDVNLRDERWLPFEGRGTVSTWSLELDPQDNNFDFSTITGGNCWTARNFSSASDWVLPLPDDILRELKSAIACAKHHGADAAPIKREDFPLPLFAATRKAILGRLRDGSWFVVLRGLPLND